MSWQFKAGDTFRISGPHGLVDDAGEPLDAAGFTLLSSIKLSDGAVLPLQASWADAPANTVLELHAAVTTGWAKGPARIDVLFEAPSGDRVTTGTMIFEVVDRVTPVA